MTFSDRLSNRDGPWLKMDRIGATWFRLALLGLTVDIDRIVIGEVDLLLRPALGVKLRPVKITSAGQRGAMLVTRERAFTVRPKYAN